MIWLHATARATETKSVLVLQYPVIIHAAQNSSKRTYMPPACDDHEVSDTRLYSSAY